MQAELCNEAPTPDLTMPLATSPPSSPLAHGQCQHWRMPKEWRQLTPLAPWSQNKLDHPLKNLLINFLRESANPLQPSNCADAPYQIYARKCIKLLCKTAEQKCVVIVRQIHLAYNEPIREPSAEEIKRHMRQIDRSRPATIQEKHPLVEYSP